MPIHPYSTSLTAELLQLSRVPTENLWDCCSTFTDKIPCLLTCQQHEITEENVVKVQYIQVKTFNIYTSRDYKIPDNRKIQITSVISNMDTDYRLHCQCHSGRCDCSGSKLTLYTTVHKFKITPSTIFHMNAHTQCFHFASGTFIMLTTFAT